MGSINTGRVVIGGLLAGVIIFLSTVARILVLREQIAGVVENLVPVYSALARRRGSFSSQSTLWHWVY